MHIGFISHFNPAVLADLLSPADSAKARPGLNATPVQVLAREFIARGHTVSLFAFLRTQSEACVLRGPGMVMHLFPARSPRIAFFDNWRRERQLIRRAVIEARPEILHAHWTFPHGLAASQIDLPRIMTIHDAVRECVRADFEWRIGFLLNSARWIRNTGVILKRFKHIIAVSPYLERYLRNGEHYNGEITVIPNSITPPAQPAVLDRPFPKTNNITFATVGSAGGIKNTDAAVAAFRIVQAHLPDSRLLAFGRLNSSIPDGVQNVEQIPYLPQAELFRRLEEEVDIFVHPSRVETQGLVLCEALMRGIPVVGGAKSGAVPWTLDNGKAGLLVDIENPNEIAAAMLRLAAEPDLRQKTIGHATTHMAQLFAIDKVIEAHLECYRNVISAR